MYQKWYKPLLISCRQLFGYEQTSAESQSVGDVAFVTACFVAVIGYKILEEKRVEMKWL